MEYILEVASGRTRAKSEALDKSELAIPNGITWALVSDVIDYSEWHNGIRKEGTTYAAFNFSRKIAQAIAAIVSAGILMLTGYVANAVQSELTLTGIKAAMTLYPGVALGLAALTKLYHPDRVNFGAYADTFHHFHVHLVPKYKDGFEWNGVFQMNPQKTFLADADYEVLAAELKNAVLEI